MASAKEAMTNIIQAQPDDSTYDEILRELALARMVDRGLADSDAERTISNEEMGHRIRTWGCERRTRGAYHRVRGPRSWSAGPL
ncbi:MAG: hypothetical protein HY814_13605 [Candidatus Riflebacteria bacterium]|nr:hypothetical protein [Candidatus Riflebacteria bacterium]